MGASPDTPPGNLLIEKDPPLGLGVRLSGRGKAQLRKMMIDYLKTANLMVAENELDYPDLYKDVREQCDDVPVEEPIGSI